MTTETVRGSELYERVLVPIHGLRYPQEFEEYRRDLKRYEKLRRGRDEMTFTKRHYFQEEKIRGFLTDRVPRDLKWEDVSKVEGASLPVLVLRPSSPSRAAYGYRSYDRSSGFTTHAGNYGLLAGSMFNREIRVDRVDEYIAVMEAGQWRDLLSDPITLTDEGQVINGQHRLAAANNVDWEKASYDPLFLVVWGVDPTEALHADLSRRTPKDQTTIVSKIAGQWQRVNVPETEGEVFAAAMGSQS